MIKYLDLKSTQNNYIYKKQIKCFSFNHLELELGKQPRRVKTVELGFFLSKN